MNTKFDYEYIRDNNVEGWQREWAELLEGRFCVQDGVLIEDQNAKLFRLGFTVKEIEQTILYTGLTMREIEWVDSHPESYGIEDGKVVVKIGAKAALEQRQKLEVLEQKLKEVDALKCQLLAGTFEFCGNNYYIDPVTINGQVTALAMLPEEYKRLWKTADKQSDNISNVYVELDKDGLLAMGLACMAAWGTIWDQCDSLKTVIKQEFAAGKDISRFEVKLS